MSEDNIEDRLNMILSSKGLIRVLSTLSERGELDITALSRLTGLNHENTHTHLKTLLKLNLIREKRYGSIRIFESSFNSLSFIFQSGSAMTVELGE